VGHGALSMGHAGTAKREGRGQGERLKSADRNNAGLKLNAKNLIKFNGI